MPTLLPANYGESLTLPVSYTDIQGRQNSVTDLLSSPAPVYTPEITQGMLDLIRRRRMMATNDTLSNLQSDFQARGGTGSSSELQAFGATRAAGDQASADEELQFLLGAADRGAQNRQFNVQTGLDLLHGDQSIFNGALDRQFNAGQTQSQAIEQERERQFQKQLADEYMARLDAINKANQRRSRRGGLASAITTGAGAAIGGAYGGLPGAQFGGSVGNSLGFLFA